MSDEYKEMVSEEPLEFVWVTDDRQERTNKINRVIARLMELEEERDDD